MTSGPDNSQASRDIYHFHESELWAAAYFRALYGPHPVSECACRGALSSFGFRLTPRFRLPGSVQTCSDWITVTNFSLDHMIPVSRRDEFRKALVDYVEPQHWQGRGKHIDPVLIAAYTWDNLTLCCLTCNKRKGTMTAVGWALLRHTMGMMNDGDKQYLWKQLLLSEHRYIPKKDRPQKITVRPHSRCA